ncbi:hypothetical protein TcG_03778 [Trypanosoma cruzi]|nr:hypothetical protein TcG_03778 [Trypanosoma cruzi]
MPPALRQQQRLHEGKIAGFPRQYRANAPGAAMRQLALPGERSPVVLFALSRRTSGRVSPVPPTRTGSLEVTGRGSHFRQSKKLAVARVMPNSTCNFRRSLRVRRFAPARMPRVL